MTDVPKAWIDTPEGRRDVKVAALAVAATNPDSFTDATLHAEGPDVVFARRAGGVALGVLDVAPGSEAYLIHTDEHGANGIAPGSYALHGKREQADEIRRVAD